MRELNFGENNQADIITKQLWSAFDILRSEPISSEDYYLILFLLSLYKDGYLIDIDTRTPENIRHSLVVALHHAEEKYNFPYLEVFKSFDHAISRLSGNGVDSLLHLFKQLNFGILGYYFVPIFDNILYRIAKYQGRSGGEFIQPLELTHLIINLAELKPNAKVYNPFAGAASFGVFLKDGQEYFGQDINSITWAIGTLRIHAHNRWKLSKFQKQNSISHWSSEGSKYELIIANPPFGMRLIEPIYGKFGNIKTVEHFVIEKGIDDLVPNGKLIALLPQSFLFRSGSEQNLRQFLIENDLVEMVISMPGGLLMQTMVKTVIFVLNKDKKHKGIVRFVDGTGFVKGETTRGKILNEVALLGIINSNEHDDAIKHISNKTIISNEYNLSVPRYFKKTFEGIELNKILTSIRRTRNNSTLGKIIRIKDLKGDKFNYQLEVDINDDLEMSTIEQEISESCLLIASVGEKLKPTYFNYTGTSIYVSPNIFILKVDEQKVDLDYLINELFAVSTAQQHYSLMTGAAMQRVRKEDFLSIKIDFPIKTEQKAKVKGLKEEHIKNRERELILERELLGLKDETFREFASIKHTFSQYLNALKSNVSGTRKFIINNTDQSINLNSVYSKNLNRTLGEHLISLEGTIISMAKLLTSLEDSSVISNPVNCDLKILVQEAQVRFSNPDVFRFENLYIDKESFSQNENETYIAPIVFIDPEDFFRVFSNVISNAVDHGFENRTKNIIGTSLSWDAENKCCILEIFNNGKPMPEEFTLQHFTTRGEKTTDSKGSGVGGADIKSILDKYEGTVEIRKEAKAEFTVTYIIKLPLIDFSL